MRFVLPKFWFFPIPLKLHLSKISGYHPEIFCGFLPRKQLPVQCHRNTGKKVWTLNIFYTVFYFFYCFLWTCKCLLSDLNLLFHNATYPCGKKSLRTLDGKIFRSIVFKLLDLAVYCKNALVSIRIYLLISSKWKLLLEI